MSHNAIALNKRGFSQTHSIVSRASLPLLRRSRRHIAGSVVMARHEPRRQGSAARSIPRRRREPNISTETPPRSNRASGANTFMSCVMRAMAAAPRGSARCIRAAIRVGHRQRMRNWPTGYKAFPAPTGLSTKVQIVSTRPNFRSAAAPAPGARHQDRKRRSNRRQRLKTQGRHEKSRWTSKRYKIR